MRGNNWALYLLFAIVFLPALLLRSSDPVSRKRKMTNLIGLAVLCAFVLAIIIIQSISAVEERANIHATKAALNQVAEGFSNHDDGIIKKWAKGEYRDVWGGPLLIGENNENVWFASKGSDGELGTEDDVVSEVFVSVPPEVDLTPIVKVPKKKSLIQKTKETAEKTKGLWGKAKGLFSKDDKDVDGTNTDSD